MKYHDSRQYIDENNDQYNVPETNNSDMIYP